MDIVVADKEADMADKDGGRDVGFEMWLDGVYVGRANIVPLDFLHDSLY